MSRVYLYDDKRSILHSLLGFVSAFLLWGSWVVIILFIVYQVTERENPTATLGDVVEFIIGYIYGLAIVVWWVYAKFKGWL